MRVKFNHQAASVLVSAYTLIAISIDRYMAIMWPLKVRMSKSQAKLSILAVWVAALTISSPIAMVSCLFQPNPRYTMCNRYVCQEIWPSDHQQYYYSIALLILQYFVPLVVLMFTYTSIGIRVWGKRPPVYGSFRVNIIMRVDDYWSERVEELRDKS
ncbi:hypothetical protein KQX54_009330 [Cotesia glomerata]|uniref:G-protein coupled receptors family 1 profile domain-containing protein n=1 Tax=Cotesia glomerata TaxID=32391 RepID=A0AAV7IH16_COTGL|nr:hypothetical protein KQX54_009330 [Cotesia glomerata]